MIDTPSRVHEDAPTRAAIEVAQRLHWCERQARATRRALRALDKPADDPAAQRLREQLGEITARIGQLTARRARQIAAGEARDWTSTRFGVGDRVRYCGGWATVEAVSSTTLEISPDDAPTRLVEIPFYVVEDHIENPWVAASTDGTSGERCAACGGLADSHRVDGPGHCRFFTEEDLAPLPERGASLHEDDDLPF